MVKYPLLQRQRAIERDRMEQVDVALKPAAMSQIRRPRARTAPRRRGRKMS